VIEGVSYFSNLIPVQKGIYFAFSAQGQDSGSATEVL
jgi:hypothetical protein